jgi:hypothetical protein
MKRLAIHLRDIDAEVVHALKGQYDGVDDVRGTQGDIFAVMADAVVSPTNSFGYMDGGTDLFTPGKVRVGTAETTPGSPQGGPRHNEGGHERAQYSQSVPRVPRRNSRSEAT